MKITKYPKGFKYKSLFSDLTFLKGFEGGVVYSGQREGKPFLVVDESTLSEFLDESDKDLLDGLIQIIEFENQYEFDNYWNEQKINQPNRHKD